MSNLKGSDYTRQGKDLFLKTAAFGNHRYTKDKKNDNKTHSKGLASKRMEMIKSFISYANSQGYTNKLNTYFNDKDIQAHLTQRTSTMSDTTKVNYIRAFGSLMTSLRDDTNVDITLQHKTIDDMVKDIKKSSIKKEKITGKAIKNQTKTLNDLKKINYVSSVILEAQIFLGLRISEIFSVVKSLPKFYNKSTSSLDNIVGKANNRYMPKFISNTIKNKIEFIAKSKLPSQRTYANHLKKVGLHSHQARFTYVSNTYKYMMKKGIEEKKILKFISKNLGHHRISMSKYYLSKI